VHPDPLAASLPIVALPETMHTISNALKSFMYALKLAMAGLKGGVVKFKGDSLQICRQVAAAQSSESERCAQRPLSGPALHRLLDADPMMMKVHEIADG
jgi:hypothetical protein